MQSEEDENEAEHESVVISPIKYNSSEDVIKDITLEGTTTNDLSLDQNSSIESSDQTDEENIVASEHMHRDIPGLKGGHEETPGVDDRHDEHGTHVHISDEHDKWDDTSGVV